MAVCSPVSHINISGVDLENVDSFRYLGSLITADGSCERDILSRIGFAQAAFQTLHTCLFSREDISIHTEMRVYLASGRSVLLYGCESWTVTTALSSCLDTCEMSFLRRILGIRVIPRTPNVTVYSQTQVPHQEKSASAHQKETPDDVARTCVVHAGIWNPLSCSSG